MRAASKSNLFSALTREALRLKLNDQPGSSSSNSALTGRGVTGVATYAHTLSRYLHAHQISAPSAPAPTLKKPSPYLQNQTKAL